MKIVELALANLNQYLYDRDNSAYTARMREPGTAAVFAAMSQKTSRIRALRGMSPAANKPARIMVRDTARSGAGNACAHGTDYD
jgi:hypothetical protein